MTILAGNTFAVINVSGIIDDSLIEGAETVIVTLTSTNNASVTLGAPASASVIITDNESTTVSIAATDPTATETPTDNGQFTVTLLAAAATNVVVNYTVSGSALPTADYTALSGSVTILAGNTFAVINVSGIVDDAIFEGNETVIVTLTSTDNASVRLGPPASATVTITDNEAMPPSVTLLVAPPSMSETGGVATVTAILSAISDQEVTVTLAFSGTAADGVDYSHPGTTIVIAAGALFNTLTLTTVSDTLDEANETIVVDIFSVTNGTELGTQQGTTTILDDDPTTATLSINDVTVTEGNAGPVLATFTVTLSAASGQTVTVNAATADNTAVAPGDYTTVPTTLITFLPGGPLTQTVTITVNGDTLDEINETYFVNLSNALNAAITDAQGIGTILDDDPATATLSINDVTVTEGNFGPVFATFTVTLSAASGQTVTVNAATANNTAVAPGDYLAVPTTLVTFAPGQTIQSFTVQVNGDTLDELTETYSVNLTGSSNAAIADSLGIGTILDDDVTPTVTLVVAPPSISETGGVAAVTATLSALSGQDVTVTLAFSGTAADGVDYSHPGTTIVIAAGTLFNTLTLAAVSDTTRPTRRSWSISAASPTARSRGSSKAPPRSLMMMRHRPSHCLLLRRLCPKRPVRSRSRQRCPPSRAKTSLSLWPSAARPRTAPTTRTPAPRS